MIPSENEQLNRAGDSMKRYWIVRVLIRVVTPESITTAYLLTLVGSLVYFVVICGINATSNSVDSAVSSHGIGFEFVGTDSNDFELQPFRDSGTPLQKDLANRVFNKGDAVGTLIEKYRPDTAIHQPPFRTFYYRGKGDLLTAALETRIISKDGKLIQAETQFQLDTEENLRRLSLWKIRFFGEDWMERTGYSDNLSAAFEAYLEDFRLASKALVGPALIETRFQFPPK